MGRYSLGVQDIAFRERGAPASVRARALGFEHIDVSTDVDPATLVLPVGCPVAFPSPQPGWCTTPAPPEGEGRWEWTIRKFRAAPGCLLEPWAGACVNSVETIRAMAEAVPGLRFLIDTGHVAAWGGDPLEVLEWADHVQLRQGRPGTMQLHVDDPTGVVDFGAVVGRLDALGYRGALTIEHFDLPELDAPLDDPEGWAVDLLHHLQPLVN